MDKYWNDEKARSNKEVFDIVSKHLPMVNNIAALGGEGLSRHLKELHGAFPFANAEFFEYDAKIFRQYFGDEFLQNYKDHVHFGDIFVSLMSSKFDDTKFDFVEFDAHGMLAFLGSEYAELGLFPEEKFGILKGHLNDRFVIYVNFNPRNTHWELNDSTWKYKGREAIEEVVRSMANYLGTEVYDLPKYHGINIRGPKMHPFVLIRGEDHVA